MTEETTPKKRPGRKPDPLTRIFAEIKEERRRQDEKWGEQNHPLVPDPAAFNRYANRADAWKATNDQRAKRGTTAWDGIAMEEFNETFAEEDPLLARAEAIQAIAVLVAMVECIDRGGHAQ